MSGGEMSEDDWWEQVHGPRQERRSRIWRTAVALFLVLLLVAPSIAVVNLLARAIL